MKDNPLFCPHLPDHLKQLLWEGQLDELGQQAAPATAEQLEQISS